MDKTFEKNKKLKTFVDEKMETMFDNIEKFIIKEFDGYTCDEKDVKWNLAMIFIMEKMQYYIDIENE